jgi:hypothetical protein
MDTKSNAAIALRLSRRAVRNIGIIGVVSCLAVTGLAAAVHGAGAAISTQSHIVSVDHTHKGDRLPLALKHYLTCLVARRDNTLTAADRM